MRAHRLLILLAAAGGALLASAPAVAAQPYPPGPADLTATPTTVVVDNTVFLHGSGYGPNDNVALDATYISFSSNTVSNAQGRIAPISYVAPKGEARQPAALPRTVVAHVTANADGAFSTTLVFDRTGTVMITGTGSPSGRSASVTVRVIVGGPTLPTTGTNGNRLMGEIGAGAGAVLLGGVLVGMTVVRRRRARMATVANDTTASTD